MGSTLVARWAWNQSLSGSEPNCQDALMRAGGLKQKNWDWLDSADEIAKEGHVSSGFEEASSRSRRESSRRGFCFEHAFH
jgi:hypothetical protein